MSKPLSLAISLAVLGLAPSAASFAASGTNPDNDAMDCTVSIE